MSDSDSTRSDISQADHGRSSQPQWLSGSSAGGCCPASEKLSKHSEEEIEPAGKKGAYAIISFPIAGMSCQSCARRIETALLNLPGVKEALVDFASGKASVSFNPAEVGVGELKASVESVGYWVPEDHLEGQERDKGRSRWPLNRGPYLIGASAALGVVGFYLGLLTLTSDPFNAWMEFKGYAGWILALSVGLGVQATLFALLRKKLRGRNMRGAKCSLAASGGMSTSAMAACCAHYLVNILPVLGVPFLSAAAAGLALYQTQFFLAGVISNLVGIGLMLRTMKKNGIIPAWAQRVILT